MPKIVDHDQRRRELVDALWRVVNSSGASAVSIRSVAAAAGIPKSNVIYYFPSRGRLLAAAVDQVMVTTRSAADLVLEEPLTIDRMLSILSMIVPTTPARRRQAEVWRLLNAEESGDETFSALLGDFNDRVRAGLRELVGLSVAAGVVDAGRDIELETARLHALVDGLSLQTMADPRRLSPADIERILRLHLEDLAAR